MNWKWMATGVLGVAVGLSAASFAHGTVSAATTPGNGHFQIREATVDEPDGQAQQIPTHEVFLLDTDTGRVWKFQGLVWGQNKDGSAQIFTEPFFMPIQVGTRK